MSHFSALGFPVHDEDSFRTLVQAVIDHGEWRETSEGGYIYWSVGEGIELWGQINAQQQFIGLNPHFHGPAQMKVRLTGDIDRPNDTELDGAIYAWAGPIDDPDSPVEGEYPFVFDLPNRAEHPELPLPQITNVQLAAFAHDLEIYESEAAYNASQPEEPRWASESFIPVGLFQASEEDNTPPQAVAIFTGRVLKTKTFFNPFTNLLMGWAQVKTLGGEFDVVFDPQTFAEPLAANYIIKGHFWLSGKL